MVRSSLPFSAEIRTIFPSLDATIVRGGGPEGVQCRIGHAVGSGNGVGSTT
jgi:hypothetical protein